MNETAAKSSKMNPVIIFVIAGIIILFVAGLVINFFEKKTGQTVNIGGQKLPDAFPKDFPVYKGARIVSSASGIQQEKINGLLVIFTTPDGLDKVVPFYKNGLTASGWTITKGNTEGNVTITSQPNETTIQVVLGDKK